MTESTIYTKYSQMYTVIQFQEKFSNKYRYISNQGWYFNNGVFWEPDNGEIVHGKIIDLIQSNINEINMRKAEIEGISEQAKRNGKDIDENLFRELKDLNLKIASLSTVNFYTQVERELAKIMAISNDMFNTNIWNLNLKNGIFELETGIIRERTDTDYHKFVCDFDYNPSATAPVWNDIVNTIIPDVDDRKFLQKILGYCLSGDIKEEKFIVFTGDGGNGKSTIITTFADMIGGYSKLAPIETFISKNNNNDVRRSGFESKRFVYCEELPKKNELNTELVKIFASYGTKISARHMRENPYEYTNTAKFIIASNFPPLISDTGRSIRRRLVVFPFRVDVYSTDLTKYKKNLEEILKKEYSGIFNWIYEGYKLWKKEGLELPENLVKYQYTYIKMNEILDEFITEMIDIDSENIVQKSTLYKVYRQWCEHQHEDNPLNKRLFYEEFAQSMRSSDVSLVKRNVGFCFKGIQFKGKKFAKNPQSKKRDIEENQVMIDDLCE